MLFVPILLPLGKTDGGFMTSTMRAARFAQLNGLLLIGTAAMTLAIAAPALASSHREAPFITTRPKVDGTDFYMFNSYEAGRAGYVTLIANYQPFEDPQGGPNYYTMDPNALYEIHIDNNGDGNEDLTFQFRFTTARQRPDGDGGHEVDSRAAHQHRPGQRHEHRPRRTSPRPTP